MPARGARWLQATVQVNRRHFVCLHVWKHESGRAPGIGGLGWKLPLSPLGVRERLQHRLRGEF